MGEIVNAFNTADALGTSDATAIAESIANEKISAAEVVEAAILRAERVNPALNAIVLKTYEDARNYSKSVRKGAFYGVPAFIKDNDNLAGYPTQMGTGVFRAKPAKHNSKFVNQFLSTGLICIGKSAMPEFGFLCSTENEKWGITRNPWNTDYTTGGSSSGSAALVASGVVPVASANDGAGSIRIPAAICGLVGLKPSRHRLYGIQGGEALPVQLVHQGVLTRTVRDTALFYAEAEKYHSYPRLPKMGHVKHAGKQRLRIAFIENYPEGAIGNRDKDTQRTQEETAKLLELLGHRVEQMQFPVDIDRMVSHFLNIYAFHSYMLTHWSTFILNAKVDRSQLEPFTEGLRKRFRANALEFPATLAAMKKLKALAAGLHKNYDIIMTPVLAHKTPKIGYFSPELSYEEVCSRAVMFSIYCGLHNVTGVPAISLPLGTDGNGMPMGVQFSSTYGNDKLLLELAYELEEAKPWKFIYEM
ncbi:amidase [Sphingobacteriales bacterium UPWRP_1]|nr:hypothetical protein B6N25_08430 [Sphingobacteriales bacterium TSM_CSS]PSJ71588.1 amidase [Sphingobacteriales bacterium UPWRP_1]